MDPTCQRCCIEDESLNHVFFKCTHAQVIWSCLGIQFAVPFNEDVEHNIGLLFEWMEHDTCPIDVKLLPFWTLWLLWKARNEFLFAKRNDHPSITARRAIEANAEWCESGFFPKSTHASTGDRSSAWEPPPVDWLKCNVDSSFQRNSEVTGVGWIVRDFTGAHVCSGMAKLTGTASILEAEASAFLYALQMVWSKGWRRVWFETDNKELTQIINKVQSNVELGTLLMDIRHWMQLLPECSLEHVNRERNQAADVLAKKAISSDVLSSYFVTPPIWLLNYLYYPFTV